MNDIYMCDSLIGYKIFIIEATINASMQNLAATTSHVVEVIIRNNSTKSLVTNLAVNVVRKLNIRHNK
jgi:hypothetical protein